MRYSPDEARKSVGVCVGSTAAWRGATRSDASAAVGSEAGSAAGVGAASIVGGTSVNGAFRVAQQAIPQRSPTASSLAVRASRWCGKHGTDRRCVGFPDARGGKRGLQSWIGGRAGVQGEEMPR